MKHRRVIPFLDFLVQAVIVLSLLVSFAAMLFGFNGFTGFLLLPLIGIWQLGSAFLKAIIWQRSIHWTYLASALAYLGVLGIIFSSVSWKDQWPQYEFGLTIFFIVIIPSLASLVYTWFSFGDWWNGAKREGSEWV